MILDGKKIASEIYRELSSKIKALPKTPTLGAVLVWDSAESLRYIGQKRKFCEQVGIVFKLYQFPKEITENKLKSEIISLNNDWNISGYIVQLPLPEHIDSFKIIRNIDPKKDVDGFHPENQGKIMIGDSTGLSPCTPAWVMKIFSYYNIDLRWKKVVILGQSNIVGKPMALMCINAGATVSSCNHSTPDISLFTREADIIISATGQARLIHAKIVKKDTIIIDVGFSIINGKISGDANTQELLDQWNSVSPVPGGVWPMTVAMLLANTLQAHHLQNER